jgi:hypothetical protein
MDVPRSADASWSLEGTSAELRSRIGLKVDAAHPDHGLRAQQAVGIPNATSLLCIRQENHGSSAVGWPLELGEVYIRGDDLIASYRPSPDSPFSPQLYWRAHPLSACEGVIESISLLVSFQTHLLDTHPRIEVSSHLDAEELIHLTADHNQVVNSGSLKGDSTIHPTGGISCIVHRPPNEDFSYAEFAAANDFSTLCVCDDDASAPHAWWEMFGEFLEKGVIRKARIHAAFIERATDIQIAAACCETIERSGLPLTT